MATHATEQRTAQRVPRHDNATLENGNGVGDDRFFSCRKKIKKKIEEFGEKERAEKERAKATD